MRKTDWGSGEDTSTNDSIYHIYPVKVVIMIIVIMRGLSNG